MTRTFYTAADVQRLVRDEGKTELVLGPRDVITALAVDTARDLGLRLVNYDPLPAWSAASRERARPASTPAVSTEDLAALVARIVAEVLAQRGDAKRENVRRET